MSSRPAIDDLIIRPSIKLWLLGGVAVAFGLFTLTGAFLPLLTTAWLGLGGYYVTRAVRGRLFVSERVLWQRGAFRDKRLLALDDLADVVTYLNWPLKNTLILMDDVGGRHVIRLAEWRDIEPLLELIRRVIETDKRQLDETAAAWFDNRLT